VILCYVRFSIAETESLPFPRADVFSPSKDVQNIESFEALPRWMKQVESYGDTETIVVVVGCKSVRFAYLCLPERHH
jgi:hypothetical protein